MTTETYGMWDQYKWQLSTKFPALLEQLAPGADEEAIQRAEAEMGISFPESLKNVYRKNNGEKDSFICGVSVIQLRSNGKSVERLASREKIF